MKQLVSVFSGTDASVHLLKGKLDMMGIACEIRKDSNAGTWGIVPDKVDLCVEPANRKEVEPVINEFVSSRYVERF